MEQTVKERLIEYLAFKKIGRNKFEKMAGISMGYITNLKNSPKQDILEKILHAAPDINRIWLLTGEGKMLTGDDEEYPRMSDNYNEGKPFYDVPFKMGYELPFNDNTSNPTCMIDFQPYNNCDFWCRATGDSMLPTIENGDIIAVKRVWNFDRMIVNRDIYAVVLKNDLRAIKRLIDKGDKFVLVSDNKEYEDQIIDKNDVLCVYRVMGSLKMKMF